jgi:hypothetical protein
MDGRRLPQNRSSSSFSTALLQAALLYREGVLSRKLLQAKHRLCSNGF